ncbi:MAG: hypothetical protein ACYTJ0_00420 [Planctomycetota bacterium]|jgi:hypothetical protein
MMRKLRGGGGDPSIQLAAFGKHPGWDDHIPDLGLQSDALAYVKRTLYTEGIAGNIDSGAWDEKDAGPLLAFHHSFIYVRRERWVLGRLWASRDGKGRSQYPMVVCAEVAGPPACAATILRRLEELESQCTSTDSAAEVTRLVVEARDALNELVGHGSGSSDHPLIPANPWAILAARAEMGPDQQGLLRLLYQIERDLSDFRAFDDRPARSTTGSRIVTKPNLGHHLRVPPCADTALETLLLWTALVRDEFGVGTDRWVIHPVEDGAVDLVIGPAAASLFYCLRVPPTHVPFTTDIPYQLDTEFTERARRRLAQVVPA